MNYYVYIYINPKDNLPFYIGKGCGDRYKHHQYPCILRDNSYKSKIIKSIFNRGEFPIIEFISNLSEEEALHKEIELINKYGKRPYGLLVNVTDGGDNPPDNKGKTHPLYGKGGLYKVTNIKTEKSFIIEGLYFWAKNNGLSGSALKEMADNKILRYSSKGLPIYRKQHKGFICKHFNPLQLEGRVTLS